MNTIKTTLAVLLCFAWGHANADDPLPSRIEKISSQGAAIAMRIFDPPKDKNKVRSAILLFHGGGWTEGDASWMDSYAAQYAELGMVALSVDYRLSNQTTVTPFDAVADARNSVRWVRSHAAELGIDPNRIVALGTSAGAHLAAATAILDEPWGHDSSAIPNALILRSPAVSVANSAWFQKLSGGASQARSLSPDLHVRPGAPPTIILQGEEDSVTPAKKSKEFCARMRASNNVCVLKLYEGVGHLFTHNLKQQEIPDYPAIDREISKKNRPMMPALPSSELSDSSSSSFKGKRLSAGGPLHLDRIASISARWP